MSKRFDWIHFYEELATKLLPYQNDRPALVNKIHAVFTDNNMKLPKLESGTTSIDMDPFTVFSLFNRRLTDQNRQTICRGLREAFSVLSAAPEYFDGIPLTDPRNSFFYRYSDDPRRGAHDIDDLWACFSAALSYADNETNETEQKFIAAYDRVRGLKGNRWKLSMGLFWVRPKFFLNLDSRNR